LRYWLILYQAPRLGVQKSLPSPFTISSPENSFSGCGDGSGL